MSKSIKITKGFDLPLAGSVTDTATVDRRPASCAITPDDFLGITPKLCVKEGDSVALGTEILHDKADTEIKILSPIAGKITAIVRGERRHIERIIITPDNSASDVAPIDVPASFSYESAAKFLKNAGLWVMMRQRPYDIVPQSGASPRDIFVTAFDSAPLAVDTTAVDTAKAAKAVSALKALTTGKVYICRRNALQCPDIAGAEMVDVEGPHPAGNVGSQIAKIAPVNKGETVFTLGIDTLMRIAETIATGRYDASCQVAVCGSEVASPRIVATTIGCDIKSLVAGDIKPAEHHRRYISGNVLTGVKVPADGWLRFPYRQLTVIPEGDDVDEFMGWASLSPKKMSRSHSTSSGWLRHLFKQRFNPDARLLGGRRALIMSEEYDRCMALDIMPEYLLKAIIGRDIEKMEQLGIYEVAPEDFALGEYADTSKTETQRIVREGLDYLRKELE